MIDRIVSLDVEGESIECEVNVPGEREPPFPDHFPDNPVLPGVLIMESMVQCCGILAYHWLAKGQIPIFVGADDFRVKRPVYPNATFTVVGKLNRKSAGFFDFKARVLIDGNTAAKGVVRLKTTEMSGVNMAAIIEYLDNVGFDKSHFD